MITLAHYKNPLQIGQQRRYDCPYVLWGRRDMEPGLVSQTLCTMMQKSKFLAFLFKILFLIKVYLIYNVVSKFLLYSKVTQSYLYMCICIYIYVCVCVCVCVHIYILFLILSSIMFYHKSYSSLCCTVGIHCLTILNVVVCIY